MPTALVGGVICGVLVFYLIFKVDVAEESNETLGFPAEDVSLHLLVKVGSAGIPHPWTVLYDVVRGFFSASLFTQSANQFVLGLRIVTCLCYIFYVEGVFLQGCISIDVVNEGFIHCLFESTFGIKSLVCLPFGLYAQVGFQLSCMYLFTRILT